MVKWPNHFISGKMFQKGPMATLPITSFEQGEMERERERVQYPSLNVNHTETTCDWKNHEFGQKKFLFFLKIAVFKIYLILMLSLIMTKKKWGFDYRITK